MNSLSANRQSIHLFGSRFYDGCKFFCNEGSAADQTAVNIDLGEKLVGVGVVHGAAVLNGNSVCRFLVVELRKLGTDKGANLLRLLGSSGLAGADSPNRLIGDDDVLQLVLGDVPQVKLDLTGDDLFGDVALALPEQLRQPEQPWFSC